MKKLASALAAVALLTLTACGSGSPSGSSTSGAPSAAASGAAAGLEKSSIEVGVIPIVDVAPIYLGVQEGLFKKEGLDVKLTLAQGGAAIVPAVTSGQMDFGFSNVTSLIVGRQKGLPLKIVAAGPQTTGDEKNDFAAVVTKADSGIKDIKGLEGKKVGVNTLANISDSTVSEAVKEAGGDPSKVQFVEMAFPDMPANLAKGNVDAIAAVEPFVTLAKNDGAVPVFSNYAYPVKDLMVATYFTSEQYVQQNPKTVAAFTKAMKASQQFAQDNPDKVRAVLSTYTKIDAAVAAKLTFPKFQQEVNKESTQKIAEISKERGLIPELPDMNALLPTE